MLIAQWYLSFRMWTRKDGRLGLQLVTILFLISMETVISTEYTIQVNHEVKIPQTMCAIVPCNFTADSRGKFKNSKGYWKARLGVKVASTDRSEVTKQNFHAFGNPDLGDCTLKITNATKEDNGSYFFRFVEKEDGTNKYNYLNDQVKVEVTDIREVDGYSIQVDQTVTVQKGLCVTIPCTFTADHMKSFTGSRGHWKTICQEFAASSDKSIVGTKPHFQLMGNPDNGDCTLKITDAKEQDSGTYHFAFEYGKDNNRKHSYISKIITIQVTDPPSIIITTPEMQNHISTDRTTNQEVTVQEGSSLALKCLVDSNPEAQVTWMKGEKNVLKKGNGSEVMLYLSKIPTSGADKYHCLAENNLGAMNKTINIIVQSDNTKYFVIAGVVGIAALLLVAVTLKLLLRSRTKNTEEENKAKNHISTDNQYDCKPDDLYENTEFGSDAKKETKETEYNTEPTNLYFNFEEESVPFEEESVYANT
ncbi:sialic acid-binding Ig-like lectin 12 isoform X2 [Rana temporaria]|uniref:sialic acid-binding Ig-like lectin 12 isoform X2 n=1 Tax=Rana temporaria TaxID=8407 RepID=UPI001AAC7CA0|nr:sialic acid-binding Ig-like lectin 12 isoform X2 [Rana temporaria]